VSKITKKQSEGVGFFVNSALKIPVSFCQKYTPMQTAFSAIFLTGYILFRFR